MSTLYLIAIMAGQRVALPAADVESVVEIEFVTAVPRTAPHVLGLSALRSRVLTVIDCQATLGLGRSTGGEIREAVVVVIEGHFYALVVDAVEDVTELAGPLQPVAGSLQRGWQRVAAGTLDDLAGGMLLVADPAALIAGPDAVAA
jgi:purine-binding chemotaxis protein CheW